jgi:hypothetical protein
MPTGGSMTLIITQDATGSRAMTPNASYKFANGNTTLTTTAAGIDVIQIFYNGVTYLATLTNDFL